MIRFPFKQPPKAWLVLALGVASACGQAPGPPSSVSPPAPTAPVAPVVARALPRDLASPRALRLGPRFEDLARAQAATGAPAGRQAGQGRLAWVADRRTGRVAVRDLNPRAAALEAPEPPWIGPGPPHISACGRYLTYMTGGWRGSRPVLWDLDAGREQMLPPLTRGDRREPDVSAGGRELVYLLGSGAGTRLCVLDVVAGGEAVLDLPAETLAGAQQPSIAADGRTVAFTWFTARGDANLALLDREAGRPIAAPTLNGPDQDRDPTLSADGRVLVFSSDRNGSFDLYAYDLQEARYMPMGSFNSVANDTLPRLLGLDDGGLAWVETRDGRAVTRTKAVAP